MALGGGDDNRGDEIPREEVETLDGVRGQGSEFLPSSFTNVENRQTDVPR